MPKIITGHSVAMTSKRDALTSTLARALAGASHLQVEAARRLQPRRAVGGSRTPPDDAVARRRDQLMSRARMYHTLGIVGRLRATATAKR